MSKNVMELVGIVIDHAHDVFKIQLDNEYGQLVRAKLSGRMRLNKINLMPGDYVKLEVCPYDLTMGRIVSRLKVDKRATTLVVDNVPSEKDEND